jgi:hypothetical protein
MTKLTRRNLIELLDTVSEGLEYARTAEGETAAAASPRRSTPCLLSLDCEGRLCYSKSSKG